MKNTIAAALGLFITGCQVGDLVFTEDDFTPELALIGFFKPSDSLVVTLYQSFVNPNLLEEIDGDGSHLHDADVMLYEDGVYIGLLQEKKDKRSRNGFYYVINHPITEGHTYRVEADKEGFKSIEAESQIPPVEGSVEAYSFNRVQSPHIGERLYDANFVFGDVYGNNWYEIVTGQRRMNFLVETSDTLSFATSGYHPFNLGQDFLIAPLKTDYIYSFVFTDELFESTSMRFDLQGLEAGFNYLEENPDYTDYTDTYYELIINIRNISQEYYDYKRSTRLQFETYEDPFAEPVPVISNVKGGKGVFAGYNEQTIVYPVGFEWYVPAGK